MIEAVAAAFAVVFVAELGDKSQLMAFTFGTRFATRWVLLGLFIAFGAINVLSVGVGATIGSLISPRAASLLAGIVFLIAAAFVWLDDDDEADGEEGQDDGDTDGAEPVAGGEDRSGAARTAARGPASVVFTVASAVGLAEFGDKTMFVTAGLAANNAGNALATWLGATLGETAAASVGLLVGRWVGARLSPTVLRFVSTVMFIVFGLAMIASALWFA